MFTVWDFHCEQNLASSDWGHEYCWPPYKVSDDITDPLDNQLWKICGFVLPYNNFGIIDV